MKQKIKLFFQDKLTRYISIIITILILFEFILLIGKWNILPPQLPLFYSLPRSNNQLGSTIQLILLPVLSLLIYLLNAAVAIETDKKIVRKLLILTSFITSSLLFIAFAKIIILVT